MRVGVGKAAMEFPDGLGLMGYGPVSGAGYNGPDATASPGLFARAMVIDQGTPETRVYLGFVDLMGGSRPVTLKVVQRIRRGLRKEDTRVAGDGADPRLPADEHASEANVWIIPSHTHSAPGHYMGVRIYDVLNQWPGGTRDDVVDIIARSLGRAFAQALEGLVEADLIVAEGDATGIGRNRSIEAFKANFDHRGGWPYAAAPSTQPDPNGEASAVDRRFFTVWALRSADRAPLGTFAVVGVHNAAVGREHQFYHPDWAGLAATALENDASLGWATPKTHPEVGADGRGAGWAAVAQGPAGDVTAIPVGETMAAMGLPLARRVASAVLERWKATLPPPGSATAADLEHGFYRWRPRDDGLVTWDIGTPVILGCEESRTPFLFNPERGEARRVDAAMRLAQRIVAGAKGIINPAAIKSEADQLPKEPALGPANVGIRRLMELDPGDEHPVHLLRIGTHVFFGLPCEVTTYASWKIEEALVQRFRGTQKAAVSASPIAMVNDYMGYLTTRAEYEMQNYEGALNLYGKRTHDAVIAAVCDTVRPNGTLQIDVRPALANPKPFRADDVEASVKRLAGQLTWSARRVLAQIRKVRP